MDEKVSQYFQKQSLHHQAILRQLREILLTTFPGISESFQWGVPMYDGVRFYLVALKNQVNLGVSIVGLDKEDIARGGKTARHIKVFDLLDEAQKQNLIPLLILVKHKVGIPV